MEITGKTKVVGLLGGDVSYSLSPLMHNACFSFLNMDWVYVPFNVSSKNLENAIKGLSALGVVGVNITIPHKIEVIKYLTKIDKKAEKMGSVNTIIFKEGEIFGLNTDGDGFVMSLKNIGFTLKDKNVLLIGAGGAGRAIGVSLAKEGIKRLAIFDVVPEKMVSLANSIDNVEVIILSKIETEGIDLLINATPQGMKDDDPLPCETEKIHPKMLVYDIIYKKTPLLINAEKRGAKIMDGSEMLIHQGALSFKMWTGIYPPIDVMRKALGRQKLANC